MSSHGRYATVDARPAVCFERSLAHPVDKVWRMITDPAELAHWFPCAVEVDLRPSGKMTFTFSRDYVLDGEVLELEPPRRTSPSAGAATSCASTSTPSTAAPA